MNLIVNPNQFVPIEERLFEAVERKGIGHPDSLADLVAETFSINYSRYCLEQFGFVANHWVDKINLVGSKARVYFGGFEILKTINAYLFGKITESVGNHSIDIRSIFMASIQSVFKDALGREDILDYTDYIIDNNSSVGNDHANSFYNPRSAEELGRILQEETLANDTVICSSNA